MSGAIDRQRDSWHRLLPKELLEVAIAIGLAWLISLATGGFVWMAGVIIAGEAIFLPVRYFRNRSTR